MRKVTVMMSLLPGLVMALSACTAPAPSPQARTPVNPEVILATTTSTQDSGLLDVLLPLFTQETGYKVKPIAVGSGQALALGERGEADVLLAHAPEAEARFMSAGHGTERRLVMHNDFVLVGPRDDPAGVKGSSGAASALARIAQTQSVFMSRGDNSGTHELEKKLWKQAGIAPAGKPWYQETGQGMGATLNIASEKKGYTLTDRATYLANRQILDLGILLEGDPSLYNVYHVILVDARKSSRINVEGARAFADFLVSPKTQGVIGSFGKERFGQALFVPDAGKSEPSSVALK